MAEDTQTSVATPQEESSQTQQATPTQPDQPQTSPITSPPSQPATNKKGLFKKLIKIVIFLVIIGTLAIAAFFLYQQMQIKGRDAQRKQDFQTIKAGLEKIRVKTTDQKYYPSTVSEAALVKTGALDKIPQDPINKPPYVYTYKFDPPACTTRCTSVTLIACLENKNDKEGIDPVAPCTTKSYKVTT
ncbi:MAG: hypothetical protein UT84_C0014G0023 [Candidatus Curtissbacteria bacterium GW2011_GWA1_40_16]|uniref:Type II secretion system protein GspG C-terminal domain-containing protein n=1 Tax=Candidatus Curtissbacteria bacterium GW2011_GWA1_40_16 TaxID=1618405 RepID=A0A0G0TT00_9BACT|nr:MAG: hypothetical protein UT84_C0014G0023 [Candidatus Curtissbacteria bacterium GW2011_GWA1_40_16]